jgi:hypothetical protein
MKESGYYLLSSFCVQSMFDCLEVKVLYPV